MTKLFSHVEMAPRDPILGLNEQFAADTRNNKVNLGVGVYSDDNGQIPVLKAVQEAEKQLAAERKPYAYLPIDGLKTYNEAAQKLLLGEKSPARQAKRAITVEALGGTGALKVGADFLRIAKPNSTVYISDPSWANHRGIFERSGFKVETYPYYDPETHGIKFDALKAFLNNLQADSIVVLHACCHNPTGVDLSKEQWQEIAQIVKDKQLVPFLDIAYQGFGEGLDQDNTAVKIFDEAGLDALISSSFSKSFSFYGQRVGALTVLTDSRETAQKVLSQIKIVIRSNYSNPPIFGAAIVAKVLNTPELYQMWEEELAQMRDRIKKMRNELVEGIKKVGAQQNFDYVKEQRGMFSFSGLTPEQVNKLINDYGIYAVKSGRICVAALNSSNIDYVAQSIAAVLKD
ncbi:aromatic amino acid transaminase [Brackiella oedipodis]|uniref:amino acid aminotransferase n=1 Tax=Brackiella oedipodis TaxID=124225 RepID=UPI000491EAD8|nr:amino acid aminotransferase [Brackiella oedipodis]